MSKQTKTVHSAHWIASRLTPRATGPSLGYRTKFEYDAVGRRTKRTLPSGNFETTQYVLTGNATLEETYTDFNGLTTILDYDEMGRLATKSTLISGVQTLVLHFDFYPTTGLRHTMTDASGTTTYTYDDMDRLLTKSHPLLGTLTYTYDLAGNVLTLQSSHNNLSVSQQGVSLTYHWDELNRLVQVDDAAGNSTTYDYDKVGNLLHTAYPSSNPITNSYTYNCLNRLTQLNVTKTTGGSTATLATFNYNPDPSNPLRRLDPAGTRRVAVESIVAGTTINREVQYSYDALYRLVKENIVSGSPSGAVVYDNSTGYAGYDNVGNRRSRQVPPALQSAALTDFNNVSFNSSDQILTSTYDPNGNTTVEALPPPAISPTVADQYDFENRLTQRSDGTTTIQIVYDGDGNRVKRSVNGAATFYLVDDRNHSGYAQVVEDMVQTGTDGSGNPLLEITRVYNYGHSLINQALWSGSAWQPYYYGYDGHGNVRFLTGSDGAIANTYTYDAFGILISQTGSTPNNYLYAGERFDSELGTYFLRARYYRADTGWFWTMDSDEGTRSDPPTLHKYLYTADNVVNRVDPSGHDDLVELMTTTAIDSALSALFSLAVEYGGDKAVASIIPEWVYKGFAFALNPDAVVVGTSLNLNVQNKGLGLTGGGGVEGLWSPHTFNTAVFKFGGGGVSFGTTKGLGSIQFYLGAVYDCLDSHAYGGPFMVASFPYGSSLVPAKFRSSFNRLVDRMAAAFIDWFRGVKDDPASEILHKTFAPSAVLNGSSLSLFWNFYGGAFGFTIGYGVLAPGGTSNVTLGLYGYGQIYPENDEDVLFR